MPNIYLNSFRPLCSTKSGRKAIERFGFPKYIDHSCRREPDFENLHPCITSLCRPLFAQKLKRGDRVIYVTNLNGVGARKVIAVLKVEEVYASHAEANTWYLANHLPVPNNIMVPTNPPKPLDQTIFPVEQTLSNSLNEALNEWNDVYIERSIIHPKVNRCSFLYRELEPPLDFVSDINGRRLVAQNPPKLNEAEIKVFEQLLQILIR